MGQLYIEFSRVAVLIVSVMVVFGIYAQAYRIWRRKSVDDFSATLVTVLLANEIIWLNYGLAIWEWPIIVVGVLNVPPTFAIFVGYYQFRKKEKKDAN